MSYSIKMLLSEGEKAGVCYKDIDNQDCVMVFLESKVNRWLDKNFDGRWQFYWDLVYGFDTSRIKIEFEFEKELEAMAFKLRWL